MVVVYEARDSMGKQKSCKQEQRISSFRSDEWASRELFGVILEV